MNGLSPTSTITDDGPAADAEPPSRLMLTVVRRSGYWESFDPVETLIADIGATLSKSEKSCGREAEATVVLSTDSALRRLNGRFRGVWKPTNVLSFPTRAGAIQGSFLGDVVLAVETIIKEAGQLGVPRRDHLAHLTVHGLLHLLGHRHETDSEADEMETAETAILANLGVPNPYR